MEWPVTQYVSHFYWLGNYKVKNENSNTNPITSYIIFGIGKAKTSEFSFFLSFGFNLDAKRQKTRKFLRDHYLSINQANMR